MIAGEPAGRSWGLSEAELAPIMNRLSEAEKNLGNVEFVIGRATNAEQAAQLLDKAGPDAPVLAIPAAIFGLSNFNRDDADRLLANWGGGVLGAARRTTTHPCTALPAMATTPGPSDTSPT